MARLSNREKADIQRLLDNEMNDIEEQLDTDNQSIIAIEEDIEDIKAEVNTLKSNNRSSRANLKKVKSRIRNILGLNEQPDTSKATTASQEEQQEHL